MNNAAGIEFRAVKRFKYNGKIYKRGDIWEPEGGKFDDQIIAAALDNSVSRAMRMVEPVEPDLNPVVRSKRNRKNAKNGTKKSQAVVEGRDAQAYELYHNEDMTYEEIAPVIGVKSPSTVGRAIKRHEERMAE